MDSINLDIFGWLGTVVVSLQFIPQMLKVIKTKSVGDISKTSLALIILGSFSWVLYSFKIGSLPVFVSNIFIIIIISVTFFMKLKYENKKH